MGPIVAERGILPGMRDPRSTVIRTKRLALRRSRLTDADAFAAFRADPVAEHLGMTWVATEHTTFKGEPCVELTYERRLEPS